MNESDQYSVRDPNGNIYGPATAQLLRQWVGEGRIIAGMSIRSGAGEWVEVSAHPAVADLFQRTGGAVEPVSTFVASPIPPGEVAYGSAPRTDGLAIASLVVGICALVTAVPTIPAFCCCIISGPLGTVGAALGAISLHQFRGDVEGRRGKGLAIAGLILSLLALSLVLGGLVFFALNMRGVAGPGGAF